MKLFKKIRGQTLVEFALLVPLLFLLIMGLFDVGRAIFYYAVLNTAVREGTRYAIVQSDCDYRSNPNVCSSSYLDSYPLNCSSAQSTANINICSVIEDKLFNISELSSITIIIDHPDANSNDPKISIDISFLFSPITPGLGLIGDITMQVNSVMLMTPVAKP